MPARHALRRGFGRQGHNPGSSPGQSPTRDGIQRRHQGNRARDTDRWRPERRSWTASGQGVRSARCRHAWSVRAVGLWSDYDGWTTNPDIGANHYNRNTSSTFRLQARYTPDPKWTIDLSYIHQYSKSNGPSVSDLDYVYAAPTAEPRNDRFDIYSLTVARDFGFATFTSATGYFDRSSFSHNDFSDEAGLASFIYGTPISTVAILRPNEQKAFTEEARLVSNSPMAPCNGRWASSMSTTICSLRTPRSQIRPNPTYSTSASAISRSNMRRSAKSLTRSPTSCT